MPVGHPLIPPIVALEGLDGSGKSTVWTRLKDDSDLTAFYFTREFLSPVGQAIQDDPGWRQDILFKLFAFPADRAWLLRKIQSLGRSSRAVVWERYIDSAIVYRGADYDLGRTQVTAEWTAELNSVFPAPIKTLYFEVTVEEALRRKPDSDPELLAAAERRYRAIRDQRGDMYVTIDASKPVVEVTAQTKAELRNVIKQLPA
jgi:dTMP kinase